LKILKKNQLTILVLALMLITAGYLNYTADDTLSTSTNPEEQLAAIGDAKLVSSGEALEEADKESILNTLTNNIENNTIENSVIGDAVSENTVGENNVEEKVAEGNVVEAENSTIGDAAVETNSNVEDEYFASSKLEREKMYSQMLESYQKILESDTISQEQKAISQEEINKINQTKNAIMISENLLKTKGFTNMVIFVNDDSVNVIIQAQTLSTEQIAQIQNIVSRELKVEIENIHISNK